MNHPIDMSEPMRTMFAGHTCLEMTARTDGKFVVQASHSSENTPQAHNRIVVTEDDLWMATCSKKPVSIFDADGNTDANGNLINMKVEFGYFGCSFTLGDHTEFMSYPGDEEWDLDASNHDAYDFSEFMGFIPGSGRLAGGLLEISVTSEGKMALGLSQDNDMINLMIDDVINSAPGVDVETAKTIIFSIMKRQAIESARITNN